MMPEAATTSRTPPLFDLRGGGRLLARVRPWPDDTHTALLTLVDPRSPALAAEIPTWIDHLGEVGYRRIRTNAVDPAAGATLTRHGFAIVQDLTVMSLGRVGLGRRNRSVSAPGRIRSLSWRRPPRRDASVAQVLDLDRRCFEGGWHLDDVSLREAATATPRRRVRTLNADEGVVGYLVTGLMEDQGFLQRLGVDPAWRRRGVARALIDDALDWCVRRGATTVVVNTRRDNRAALELYSSFGFRPRPDGLVVVEHVVSDSHPRPEMRRDPV